MNSQLLPPKGGSLQVSSGGYAIGRIALCSLTARVRLIDGSPTGNIHRRDVVGEPGVSAGHAGECTLVRTIGFRDMLTLRTSLRRIARIDRDDRHTSQRRLILDFCPEIAKGPAMQLSPVRLPSRYPTADTRQVFDGDPASGVFGALYKQLADAVVHVSGKAVFFMAALLEQAFSRLRFLLLELCPQPRVAMAQSVQVGARIVGPVAVGGDVRHASVNAKELANILWVRRLDIAGDEQIELAIDVTQVGLAPVVLQQFTLAVAALIGHALATLKRPDAHRLLAGLEAQDATVIGERAVRLESVLYLLVKLVGVSDFRNSPHHHLSRYRVALTDVAVNDLMDVELPEGLGFPRLLADVVTGGVSRLKCVEQHVALVGRRLQFDLSSQFHNMKYSIPWKMVQASACSSFLSPLKGGVSGRRF